MELVEHGLYIVKDEYFNTFHSDNWMWNKKESRPQYLAIADANGIFWMIPMSSRADHYKAKIEKEEAKRGAGNCIYYHIGLIAGIERAFIISGMFPITTEYISHPFEIDHQAYIVRDSNLNRALYSKMQRYLRLLEQKQLRDQNHVLNIRSILQRR